MECLSDLSEELLLFFIFALLIDFGAFLIQFKGLLTECKALLIKK